MQFQFNPLTDDLGDITDAQLDEKLRDLYKKYNMTANTDLQNQMIPIIEMLRSEQTMRMVKKQSDQGNSDLDNLINID